MQGEKQQRRPPGRTYGATRATASHGKHITCTARAQHMRRRRAHRVDRRRLEPWVDVALCAHVGMAASDLRQFIIGELSGCGQRTRLVELVREQVARGADAAGEPVRE